MKQILTIDQRIIQQSLSTRIAVAQFAQLQSYSPMKQTIQLPPPVRPIHLSIRANPNDANAPNSPRFFQRTGIEIALRSRVNERNEVE